MKTRTDIETWWNKLDYKERRRALHVDGYYRHSRNDYSTRPPKFAKLNCFDMKLAMQRFRGGIPQPRIPKVRVPEMHIPKTRIPRIELPTKFIEDLKVKRMMALAAIRKSAA